VGVVVISGAGMIILSLLFLVVFWGAWVLFNRSFPNRVVQRITSFSGSTRANEESSPPLIKHTSRTQQSSLSRFTLFKVVSWYWNRARQRRSRTDLPDALDLLCVCMEAGLAMDAALHKVAHEMQRHGSELGNDLQHLSLSLSAGMGKEAALRQFAESVGGDEVKALVSLLLQAERFGTSVVASLRVQSDMIRERRKQNAEEQASKIGLKMLMPLVLCHLPALFMVLLGPACIDLYRNLSPLVSVAHN